MDEASQPRSFISLPSGKQAFLHIDESCSAEIEGRIYHTLSDLAQDHPEILSPTPECCRLINCLLTGLSFEPVQSQDPVEISVYDSAVYGPFNFSAWAGPRMVSDELQFCVVHAYTRVPYQVRIPLENPDAAQYELFPYAQV